ncbi:MAG: Matrixin [Actinomycetota bacterium]
MLRWSEWRPGLVARPLVGVGAALLAFGLIAPAPAQTALTADEFRLLPLRVHLMQAKAAPELHTRLTDKDVRRVLGKVNGIWMQAGIQFFEESIRTEEAAGQELYAQLGESKLDALPRLIRPRGTRSPEMFHLYFIGQRGPNGVCFDGSPELLFIKESARLQSVRGGIDEPLPRVAAHEMGHALTLEHRQDRTNLMASGTTGTSLNDAEIAAARRSAEGLAWRLTPADALSRAGTLREEKATGAARSLYAALAGLPGGEVARTARESLAALSETGGE